MTGRSWTRGRAPQGKQQYYKCDVDKCPDYCEYDANPPEQWERCDTHRKRMDQLVYEP